MTPCTHSPARPASAASGREPGRALLWLVVLAVAFYASYGFANWSAAQRVDVPVIMFDWERRIPFLPWTILPYWSINLFFGLAVFVCADRHELGVHIRRVFTAQGVAVACFLLWPLQLGTVRPATEGLPGLLFAVLAGFDRPYNQAPSLHIALLVILWPLYARHVPRRWHPPLHAWALLIGVSVLTTGQHHFIDLPTGALLGLACLWLWPEQGASPLRALQFTRDSRRVKFAALYAAGAAVFAVAAATLGGWALWLFWPAVSLLLVAANYLALGPAGFQKRADGGMPLVTRILLAPYLGAARLNAWAWTRGDRAMEIADGVWLGALHDAPHGRFATVIDLCAELPAVKDVGTHVALPALDLVPLTPADLRRAVAAIDAARGEGPVLVACALGYGRSAAAVAGWLQATRRAASWPAACAAVQVRRPRAVFAA